MADPSHYPFPHSAQSLPTPFLRQPVQPAPHMGIIPYCFSTTFMASCLSGLRSSGLLDSTSFPTVAPSLPWPLPDPTSTELLLSHYPIGYLPKPNPAP